MDKPLAQKQDWVLTGAALDRLLEQLDADRDRAAEKYEQIRQRLMKLFRWRGCLDYEEYADHTIDRVARRLAEGADIHTENPYSIFYGVAMNLLKEHWRHTERDAQLLDGLQRSYETPEDPEERRSRDEEDRQQQARLDCLRRCLRQLPNESLLLIKRYYAEGDVLDKNQRQQMAERLGITVNALRVRAFRIRGEVERCIDHCLTAMEKVVK